MNIHSDNLLQRQSRNAVAMTKGVDYGSGKGGWEEGDGCEREGRGFETSRHYVFLPLSLLITSYPKKKKKYNHKPLFCIYPESPLRHCEVQNCLLYSQTDSKGVPKSLIQSQ